MVDLDIVKTTGQVAGIGGLAIGTLLILFREVIRKNIFPNLTREYAYKLLRLIVVLAWSVAIFGIIAWIYVTKSTVQPTVPGQLSSGSNQNAESMANECEQEEYGVILFKYHGAEQLQLSTAFDQFQGILQDKLVALTQELKASNSNCKYLNKLHLCYTKQLSPSGYDSILNYWTKNGRSALELLAGTIFMKKDEAVVSNRAYFNDSTDNKFSDDLRTLNFDLTVSPDEFGTTRDTHSLITLYALAMDAKREKLSDDVVAEYLSRAFSLSKDLGRKDIQALIEKELKILREHRA